MHDLHEADKISKLAADYAKKNNLKKISRITINLGSISEHNEEINPENLQFNIKQLLINDDRFKDVEIIIKKVQSDTWELESMEGE